ncbi:MAG TPA: ribose 5-phosphate isomerase A [Oligoflexia bacterium]|nr:ribose 5-phosphate isomerase A [Oligoflexia bacterium]HMP26925.1 ribose 5-phosphate isomerase A [Oligoflexia bacterium]
MNIDLKKTLAKKIANQIKDGEIVGVGTGSTVEAVISEIGLRISNEGIKISAVPSSTRTALALQTAGITTLTSRYSGQLAWSFDGADLVEKSSLWSLKGAGGLAMLGEKIMATRSERFIVLISEEKFVDKLQDVSVPIEVVPQAIEYVRRELLKMGAKKVELKLANEKLGPAYTESGNLVLFGDFLKISRELNLLIKSLTGVVETGLFIGEVDEIYVGKADGSIEHFVAQA